ncbi:hypothetical protein [Nonomuraea harbinensis]|uniref:Uncharacterized protein n=1 Tax=Nonomuraea harbinensis TaxID=1286938 RepID=A0ABW1BXB5_9ACTN|nr:hypothetical protein [Nonomuraea harbinensis]
MVAAIIRRASRPGRWPAAIRKNPERGHGDVRTDGGHPRNALVVDAFTTSHREQPPTAPAAGRPGTGPCAPGGIRRQVVRMSAP